MGNWSLRSPTILALKPVHIQQFRDERRTALVAEAVNDDPTFAVANVAVVVAERRRCKWTMPIAAISKFHDQSSTGPRPNQSRSNLIVQAM